MGSVIREHAEISVTLVASVLLIVVIVIWVKSSDDFTAVRDYGLLIATIVAFPLAFWRSKVAERQADAARRQVEAAEQGLQSERFRQGTEMLGHELKSVRLGGIYTLDRLARDFPEEYHIPVMQTLCAFVRHPPTDPSQTRPSSVVAQPMVEGDEYDDTPLHLVEDIHAVLEVIRLRSQQRLDIESTNNFELNLSGADLRLSDLRGASLSGDDLSDSRLSGSLMMDADLSGAHLQRADLTSPNKSRPSKATKSDIHEGRIPATTRLDNVDLTGALALGAKMRGVILSGSDLSGANLPFVTLADSLLMHTNFSDAHLSDANLSGAELHGANFAEAMLSDANLSGTDFSGSCLFGHPVTPQRPAIGLTQKQLDSARADPANPPRLDGVVDADTGCQLVWNGKVLDDG
ncbi:MAG: pentapeptide repeat-containing protein [Chloroflexota bacterium]|nr:pentapeptide repeat-containing protein [Chloroflexota bacterium]